MSLTGFQRRRRELAVKAKAVQLQTDSVEPQEEAPEKTKRRKKGGDRDVGG
jgi:hypothetical protein